MTGRAQRNAWFFMFPFREIFTLTVGAADRAARINPSLRLVREAVA